MKEIDKLLKVKQHRDEVRHRRQFRSVITVNKRKGDKTRRKIARKNKKIREQNRALKLQQRMEMGDVHSKFKILVVKDGKRIKKLATRSWKTEAFARFNELVEKNKEEVKLPVVIAKVSGRTSNYGVTIKTHDYEIILVQRVDNLSDNVTYLKDENGKYVEHVVVDDDSYIIIAKDKWLIPEKYNVYGYHPRFDRKTFDFILNEIVLKDTGWDNMKRVYFSKTRVFVQTDSNFDMITCKTCDEAIRLYNKLEECSSHDEFVFFTGELTQDSHRVNIHSIAEKTGWTNKLCNH